MRYSFLNGGISTTLPGFPQPPSPVVGDSGLPLDEHLSFIPFDSRPVSPSPSDISSLDIPLSHVNGRSPHPLFDAVR